MPRAESTVDTYAYEEPDPVTVAHLIASHGQCAARERWHWVSWEALRGIGQTGREILRARATERSRPARRTTTPEQEDRIIAVCRDVGSVSVAARTLGVGEALIRTLHRERDLDYPKTPVAVRIAREVEARKRNAAGRTPLSQDAL